MNAVSNFVKDVIERAVKTAAQAALLAFGSEKLNVLHADWRLVGGLAGGGFVLSVLTSLASQPVGDKSSASLLSAATEAVLTPPADSGVSDL